MTSDNNLAPMYQMNSLNVQRMMAELQRQKQADAEAAQAPKTIRQPRRKKEVEHIEPESDSGDDSSSYSSFESLPKIHKKFDEEPCEYVSPAKLHEAQSKKEAMKYLESKSCPKIPTLKKTKMSAAAPASPMPETAPVKKIRKAKVEAPAPEPVPEPVAAPAKVKKVKAAPAPAPVAATPAPAAAPKAKRPASEYAKLVGKYRKEKLSFADAAKKAKAELDAKKSA